MNKKYSKDLLEYNLKKCKIILSLKHYNMLNIISDKMLVLLHDKKDILSDDIFDYYYNEFYHLFNISAKEIVDK